MPSGVGLALGGAVLGGIAGSQDDVSTQQKNVAPASAQEKELQDKSMQNYLQQQNLANQQEQNVGQAGQFQGQAQGAVSNVLNGNAFNISPQQQAQIDQARNANIQAGQGDIENFVNNSLSKVSGSAADRGVRGQALSELQGRAIGEGTRQYANLVGQANAQAAQQSIDNPYRQASLQGQLGQQNVGFQNNLINQAEQNRQQLQNPALMNALQNERLASAGVTNTQEANAGTAIGGALGGAGSLLAAGGSAKKAGLFFDGGFVPGYYRGGEVQKQSDERFHQNAEDFQRGFNSGPDISRSIRNIGDALGLTNHDENKQKNMAHGGMVPGRAHFLGDTPMNDTETIKVSPGELIIPRSHAHDPKLAKAFVDYIHNKDKKKGA